MAPYGLKILADILGRKDGAIRGTREAIWDPNLGRIPKFGPKFGTPGPWALGPPIWALGPPIWALGPWAHVGPTGKPSK